MPTYEYECRDCGGHFEFFQGIKEAPKQTCEKCGGSLQKLLSAGTGLIFKGSGFYITDYKSSGGGGGATGSSSSGAGEKKSSGSGEGSASGGGESSSASSSSSSSSKGGESSNSSS